MTQDVLAPDAATVKGRVGPNGQLSVYQFDYGKTAKYGLHTSSGGAGSGLGPRPAQEPGHIRRIHA